jgi:hypothetical protein
MLNPFITYVVNEQEAYASIICVDGSNNVVVVAAEMENCSSYKSYFYYSGLFSDLSRNMTSSPGSNSSSDLIEDNNEDTEVQDDVENNAEPNLQDETAATELQENDDGNNANTQ